MTPQQKRLKALRDKQRQLRSQARAQLSRLANAGNSRNWMSTPGWGPLGTRTGGLSDVLGGTSVNYGEAPQEAQVERFVQQHGGYPTMRNVPFGGAGAAGAAGLAQQGAAGQAGMAQAGVPAPNPSDALAAYMAAQQAASERARQENLKRYDEGHRELTDLRSRNQDRVGNWGHAAQQDIDERMREALSEAKANAAMRGLANSNVIPALQIRSARDTAREQQRVSEMRDDRLSRYDTQDTGNLVGFVERRDDIGPDPSTMAQLAMQYGQMASAEQESAQRKQSLAERAAALRKRRGSGLRSIPFGGVGRLGGVRAPIVLGPGPLEQANQLVANSPRGPGFTWNLRDRVEYPTSRIVEGMRRKRKLRAGTRRMS